MYRLAKKQLQFDTLVANVQRCNLCPRMANRRRVLGPDNGPINARVVFIAEAPGRLGADKSGVPLYGDQAGRNFQSFLEAAGIDRSRVFITNAVLCNPRTPDGRNDSPSTIEVKNCSIHLMATLKLIGPEYIVPTGLTALRSLCHLTPHTTNLADGVGKLFMWNGYRVFPLYHPSSRCFIHRSKSKQQNDYGKLAKILA